MITADGDSNGVVPATDGRAPAAKFTGVFRKLDCMSPAAATLKAMPAGLL